MVCRGLTPRVATHVQTRIGSAGKPAAGWQNAIESNAERIPGLRLLCLARKVLDFGAIAECVVVLGFVSSSWPRRSDRFSTRSSTTRDASPYGLSHQHPPHPLPPRQLFAFLFDLADSCPSP